MRERRAETKLFVLDYSLGQIVFKSKSCAILAISMLPCHGLLLCALVSVVCSNVRAQEKREGGGAHNWGNPVADYQR